MTKRKRYLRQISPDNPGRIEGRHDTSIAVINNRRTPRGIKLLAKAQRTQKRIIWRDLPQIPLPLRQAVVSVEDERFYQHKGIDIRGIARAILQNIRYGRQVQGGSTITQQLAKNILLTQEKTFRRKLVEVSYAIRIERQYTKDQILEMYLNDIYFGQGAYGVESAAQTYFGRSVKELSLEQLALLAGLPKGPEYFSPFTHPKRAIERRNTVLTVMKQHGIVSSQQLTELTARPLATLSQPGVATRGSYFADY
ncbi:MAG TPA: transglycosylase domain-containing protein, partial [Bacillota bacterium]|nr:transglycosylase domain-containing protein [Bacillota bacterium]